MTTTQTLIGQVTDDTPASLEYGDYRGYVEIDAATGEWVRNVEDDELGSIDMGEPVYSVEYRQLRPVLRYMTTTQHLYDYETGEDLGIATADQIAASDDAAEKDAGRGVFDLGGRHVYTQ